MVALTVFTCATEEKATSSVSMRSDDKGAVEEYERYHVSLHRTALPPKSPLPRSARLVINAAGSVAPTWHRCLIRSA
uniref:Uncharacterized protein n=1 Tax=Oryza sativa subsp. japonica TaxID=39947 RepID=Q6Z2D9_ORYSJ|nr:hypothetical protein [Oryza sativa Japonica Group]